MPSRAPHCSSRWFTGPHRDIRYLRGWRINEEVDETGIGGEKDMKRLMANLIGVLVVLVLFVAATTTATSQNSPKTRVIPIDKKPGAAGEKAREGIKNT